MSQQLVVVGAGGLGREVLDTIQAINATADELLLDVVGVIDDAPSQDNVLRLKRQGFSHLGGIDRMPDGDVRFIVAVGDPAARRRLSDALLGQGRSAVTLIHPTAILGSCCTVGTGVIIGPGAVVSTNVTLGDYVSLGAHVTIGHDAVLSDHVSINPAATISGGCVIAPGTLVGAAAVVLQGLIVGARSIVGAAACVVRDVPGGAVVKGVPAR